MTLTHGADRSARQTRDDPAQASEPPAFLRLPGDDRRALLLCDHASRRVPTELAALGLPDSAFDRHIACDLHAAELTTLMARTLGLPALLHGFSRLVVDANRFLDDPTLCPARSDGTDIPGNAGLDDSQRRQRWDRYHQPYHRAIADWLAAHGDDGHCPALISIHTFSPRLNQGQPRPWQVGVLWNEDGRMALPFMANLTQREGVIVGDNEPYSGRVGFGYTMAVHAEPPGLPHLLIEVRQDLLAEPEQRRLWASRLCRALQPLIAEPALYTRWRPTETVS